MKKMLALLCTALLLAGVLTGCGGSLSRPQKTANTFFHAVQTLDVDAINACGENGSLIEWDMVQKTDGGDAQQLTTFLRALAAKMTYTITDTEITDTQATVRATVQYADAAMLVKSTMTDVMAQMMMSLFSDEAEIDGQAQFYDTLLQNVETESPTMQAVDVALPMVKTDDGWRIREMPEDLFPVLTGNTIEALQEAAETFSGVAEAEIEN